MKTKRSRVQDKLFLKPKFVLSCSKRYLFRPTVFLSNEFPSKIESFWQKRRHMTVARIELLISPIFLPDQPADGYKEHSLKFIAEPKRARDLWKEKKPLRDNYRRILFRVSCQWRMVMVLLVRTFILSQKVSVSVQLRRGKKVLLPTLSPEKKNQRFGAKLINVAFLRCTANPITYLRLLV
jgi:hypothetical protein